MNPPQNHDSLDILLHFGMEPDPGKVTLDQYLNRYPELAEDLIELSRQMLSERKAPPVTELRPEDNNIIDRAWERFRVGISGLPLDPFVALSVPQQREIATVFGVQRSVLSALRDRVVLETSIPRAFLRKLAAEIGSSLEDLARFLATPPALQTAQSYKADEKPQVRPQITFEEVLIQAKTPPGVMQELLKED